MTTTGPDHPVIGIDPGARDTGIIGTHKDRLIFQTIHNDGPMLPLDRDYLARIINAVDTLLDDLPGASIRVESVVRPSWHVQTKASHGAATNPEPLLSTAIVLGAILGTYPNAHIVPPGHNGSKPLAAYPECLVSDRERSREGWQTRTDSRGKLRHMRSAWDIATHPGPLDQEPTLHADTAPASLTNPRRRASRTEQNTRNKLAAAGPRKLDLRRRAT